MSYVLHRDMHLLAREHGELHKRAQHKEKKKEESETDVRCDVT